jgi:3-isopropylmalate/(R)-2-methylmalate dehydratase large subunit
MMGSAPSTLAQKLLARAAGASAVPGQTLQCQVDLAILSDAAVTSLPDGTTSLDLRRLVLSINEHAACGNEVSVRRARVVREWATAARLPHLLDGQGASAAVAPQRGLVRPGQLVVSSEEASGAGGAFGALVLRVGVEGLADALATTRLAVDVPHTVFMRWIGRLCDGVCAQDMALAMLGRHGDDSLTAQVVEYCGEAVMALSLPERMTLTQFSPALGAQAGLVAPDETTLLTLLHSGVWLDPRETMQWRSDEDAPGTRHSFDASVLAPQVAMPERFSPQHQVRSVDDVGNTPVHWAYLGGAHGGKLDDLRAAARVLAGFSIAPEVRLLVAPATPQDREAAQREGILRRLSEAGATVLQHHCDACTGEGAPPPEDCTVIPASARPFAQRAGCEHQLDLASPFTVAASALRGRISDARDMLA